MAITAEKKAQIQEVIEEAVAAGTPLTKKLLAERMGVSQPTMANYLHEMGVDLKTMASQLKKPASQAASPTEGDASLLLTDAELKKYIDDIEKVFSDAEKDRAAKESLYQLLKPALLVKGSEMTQADKKDGLVMQWRNYLHAEDRNVISRDSQDDQEQGVRFFGFIQYMDRIGGKEGAYKGLSYIVFPMEGSLYAVTLNVGTDDYGTDEYLARKPGTWRGWKRILEDHANLCTEYEASKFDIKMSLADRGSRITENKNIIPTSRYQTTTLAFAIVDASTIEGLLMMLGMLAQYAEMRGWSQEAHRKLIFALLNKVSDAKGRPGTMEDQTAVEALVKGRRFVVLQGAPGTGKTRLARQLVKEQVEKHPAPVREEGAIPQVFFTQFHAETSYSDFVYGLQPDTETAQLSFKPKEGKLVEAIRAAKALYDGEADKQKVPPVYLIIDEINRANLASVLGPTFYLFEPGLDYDKGVPVEIVPGPQNSLTLTALPPNLYVIATMNTADRSLAVVDFALRRRFAWYTMKPQAITLRDEDKKHKYFASQQFDKLSKIFDEFATDEELNLKPGHAYFIVNREMVQAEWTEKDGAEVLQLLETHDFSEILAKPIKSAGAIAKLEGDKKQTEVNRAKAYELIQRAVKTRLRYEVMPLIKEYLAEGMLPEAKNDFLSFFWHEIGETMIQ